MLEEREEEREKREGCREGRKEREEKRGKGWEVKRREGRGRKTRHQTQSEKFVSGRLKTIYSHCIETKKIQ